MLTVFTPSLITVIYTALTDQLGVVITTRLLILITWATGITILWRARIVHSTIRTLDVNSDRLRLKRWSITLWLMLMLLYSFTLSKIGYISAGIFSAFLVDYLLILPLILLLLPWYLRWVEPQLQEAEDADYRFGQVLTGKRRWQFQEHKAYLLAWVVKIVFIPIMYGSLLVVLKDLLTFDWHWNPTVLVAGLYLFGLTFDVIIASGGYIFANRILGTEVRSTDGTLGGWLVCLICYPPLWFVLLAIREQADAITWSDWLLPNEPLYWLWATLVTMTWMIYWLSTASFGLRFSNLTYRGLIAHGPYRWSRHPAYLSKNIYWWLHTVPFVGVVSGLDLARNLAGLTFVAIIYWLRAKTEERHLMRFPEYAAYSAWIDEHGLFARLRRRVRRGTGYAQ